MRDVVPDDDFSGEICMPKELSQHPQQGARHADGGRSGKQGLACKAPHAQKLRPRTFLHWLKFMQMVLSARFHVKARTSLITAAG